MSPSMSPPLVDFVFGYLNHIEYNTLKEPSTTIAISFKCSHCFNSLTNTEQISTNKLAQAVECVDKGLILVNLLYFFKANLSVEMS